jgi:hypothetical protein
MEVFGMPDQFHVGTARISHTTGPIRTQRTQIVQRPGWRPLFEKSMEHVLVGDGLPLTVCELEVTVELDLMDHVPQLRTFQSMNKVLEVHRDL